MAFSAETYIHNTLPCLRTMCNIAEFQKMMIPFQEDYHPELEMSELLSGPEISKYKSLIGNENWLITLGHLDIQYAIFALFQYSMAPLCSHMEVLHKVFGYLTKYP